MILVEEQLFLNLPFLLQPFNLGYDNFLGRLAICRIYQGKIKNNNDVFIKKTSGEIQKGKLTKLFTFDGIKKKEERKTKEISQTWIMEKSNLYAWSYRKNKSHKSIRH